MQCTAADHVEVKVIEIMGDKLGGPKNCVRETRHVNEHKLRGGQRSPLGLCPASLDT